MSGFGYDDPREMPAHFFRGSIRIDYTSAVRGDPEKQNASICPRHWYVDTTFPCDRCGGEFTFTADEQRVWFEEYGFWVDSLPRHCLACRRNLRKMKGTRREYDRCIGEALEGKDLETKERLAGIIDRLYELGGELPPRLNENRRVLGLQIERSKAGG